MNGFKILLIGLVPLLLSACGFHSVYGSHSDDGSPVAEQLAQIAIDPIADRSGQVLRNDLIDRMYGKSRPAQPLYHLATQVTISVEDLGTLENATTALSSVHFNVHYTLTDTNGKNLVTADAGSTALYDKLSSQYGTLAAHDSAIERTAHEVSEQMVARISLYFAEKKPATP